MIFAGQEKPLIIFRSKERYIWTKTNLNQHEIAEIKRKRVFLTSFTLGGTLSSVFNFLQLQSLIMHGAFKRKGNFISENYQKKKTKQKNITKQSKKKT